MNIGSLSLVGSTPNDRRRINRYVIVVTAIRRGQLTKRLVVTLLVNRDRWIAEDDRFEFLQLAP
jgi:hypothetical protein